MTSEYGILVGVTSPGDNTAAMTWAGEASERTGLPVTLVHVLNPVVPPPPPSILMANESIRAAGRHVLKDAVSQYAALTGRESQAVLEEGHAASILIRLSKDADLLVLGHRHFTSVRRIVTWSTATSVAAHAHCPVVAVPGPEAGEDAAAGASRLEGEAAEQSWVTVGVHGDGTPEAAVRAGFEAASTYGRPLRLVHSWRLDPVYDDMIVSRVGAEWRATVTEAIEAAAQPLTDKYPDVDVEVRVEHHWAPDTLADLATSSSLLVVGRHGHHPMMPERLGAVARTALHRAPCPVMVVPV